MGRPWRSASPRRWAAPASPARSWSRAPPSWGSRRSSSSERLERAPGLWERLTAERKTYALATQAALAEQVVRGEAVYHGLAGHLLLREIPEVLRVRLIAPVEIRVKALMEQRRMTREDAERFIAQVDSHRVRWTRLMYNADIEDPRLYDIVLNLEKTTIQSGCDTVITLARRPEFTIDDAARARFERLRPHLPRASRPGRSAGHAGASSWT